MIFLCEFYVILLALRFKFLLKSKAEMKKFLLFILVCVICMFNADAAVRGENSTSRGKSTTTTSARTTRSVSSRTPLKTTVSARASKPTTVLMPKNQSGKTATRISARSAGNVRNVTARATTNNQISASETRTGAEYEQCKTAFFTCMDQFCQLKNDNYRRCSCSNRIFDFQDIADTYQKAGEQLTEFSENLDVVGMSKEQALAMKTASAGEDALTEDKSTSKQLLQAIMNSIRGESSSVGGKYQDLNSINLATDFTNAFGMEDSGQIIASYNGETLYKAVYPKCKNAVQEDCNKASLQRAINAYLMAIEQDCNTVQSALKKQQKTLKASTHESSAMLDLARIENRQKHNSDDVATCLSNVESAIQSEQVCGANYHKCLDNGQFIDVNTGAPLTGVADFYKLGELLTFKTNTKLSDQKLSTIQKNRTFVQFFENKTKKFAQDALDTCTESADFVWQQYLDRALLDIYYAQQAKVKEIKQSCLDLVASCYDNQNSAIANAMANLTGDSSLLLKPATISLSKQMCNDYIESCNGMFDGDIIQAYITSKDTKDTLTACRTIAQQCFDNFGGTGYNGFYYTQGGLFAAGQAMDWFSIYQYENDGSSDTSTIKKDSNGNNIIVSPCANQVAQTPGCEDLLAEVFGGFDRYDLTATGKIIYSAKNKNDTMRQIRPSGVATEIYYKIIDDLTTKCAGLGGYFVEYKNAVFAGYKPTDFCKINSSEPNSIFYINPVNNSESSLVYWYHFLSEENICPLNYGVEVDTQSWGMCSCWENGGYRSKNGTLPTCRPIIPALSGSDDPVCSSDLLCSDDDSTSYLCVQPRSPTSIPYWCQQSVMSTLGQICPTTNTATDSNDNTKIFCADTSSTPQIISTVRYDVPHHSASDE